jgi:hypothetical protein
MATTGKAKRAIFFTKSVIKNDKAVEERGVSPWKAGKSRNKFVP